MIQSSIQSLLDGFVSAGKERGLQVAAYLDGALLVEAFAGVADHSSGRAVTAETLFPVFSTTKGIAATIIHLLAERGQLRYDDPISRMWPEFGAHGKERITLRQALNHSSGIPQMPNVGFAELCDWDAMCAAVADLTPLWPPGTRMEYHAKTFGWIVGEVARRVDGRPFPQLVQEEICDPLNIDTLHIGIPDEGVSEVATLEEPGVAPLPPDDGRQGVLASLGPLHEQMNRPDVRRACLPSTNGIMNARAIARHYAALLPGGVDGVELLPPSRIKLATEPQKPAHPENEDYPKCFGLGYQIGGEKDSIYGGATAFGHAGYGGSVGFGDTASGLAVGITKNLFHQQDTVRLILKELRKLVKLR